MIDPCGMVMDWLTVCLVRPFWFHAVPVPVPVPDAPLPARGGLGLFQPRMAQNRRQTMIRWYRAPEGALDFPHATSYRSSFWDSFIEACDRDIGEIPSYLRTTGSGELIDGTLKPKWSRGDAPLGATGQSFCGRPEWFADYVPPGGMPRGPGGLPACCNPALGAAVGLERLPVISPSAAVIGLTVRRIPTAVGLSPLTPALTGIGLASVQHPDGAVALSALDVISPEAVGIGLAGMDAPAGEIGMGPLASSGQMYFSRGTGLGWSVQWGNFGFAAVVSAAINAVGIFPIVTGSATQSQQRWYHLAVVWDLLSVSIYQDGNLDASAPAVLASLRPPVGGDAWNTNGSVFNGDWSLIRIYQAALTDGDVALDAMGTAAAGLVAEYPCDDGAGVTVTDTVGAANGTLDVASWLADGPGGGCVHFAPGFALQGNFPSLLSNVLPFTVTIWYRPPRT